MSVTAQGEWNMPEGDASQDASTELGFAASDVVNFNVNFVVASNARIALF
jgi:hypothetical protein